MDLNVFRGVRDFPSDYDVLNMMWRRIQIGIATRIPTTVCLDIWGKMYHKSCYDIQPFFCPKGTECYKAELGQYGSIKVNDKDVSAVVQLSDFKLDRLASLAKEWTGPISVALLTNKTHDEISADLAYYDIPMTRVMIHLVSATSPREYYPINFLRNLATQFCSTDLFIMLDVDFIPLPGDLYSKLFQKEYKHVWKATKRRHAFVIPAFEFKDVNVCGFGGTEECIDLPSKKSEVVSLCNEANVNMFHSRFPGSHTPTNYQRWAQAKRPYYISWRDNYEPYLILRRSDPLFPWFDERFVNRGRNKIVFTTELSFRGWKFVVLPEPFVIHVPESKKHRSGEFMAGYDRLYKAARREKKAVYAQDHAGSDYHVASYDNITLI